jgi:SNF2 family DNA or RNA helicase
MRPSEVLKFSRPLRAHQSSAVDRFADAKEMALLWEMGTGKTTEGIAFLRWRYTMHKQVLPTLIISPVATLYNWLEEFKINAPQSIVDECLVPYMRTKKSKYTNKDRAKLIKSSGKKIFILNPESLDSKEVVAALLEIGITCLVLDESHKFKSYDSKRLKALLTIADRATYRVISTGTPILNSYLDIWAQWRILDNGETFGKNFFVFRETYFRDENAAWKGQQGYFPSFVPRPETAQLVSQLMDRKATRIRKEECLDLPPLINQTIFVEMSDEQARAYYAMEDDMLVSLKNGTCAATNALTKVLRMLQIVSGHLTFERDDLEKTTAFFSKNPRIDALSNLLEELCPQHKVIVWCTFTENYAAIRKLCEGLGIEFAELTGQTKNRQEEIDKFQKDEKCRVMISNPQAGGVGVNLTAASYAIYYSRSYSLGDRLQSEARNHRGGSEVHKSIVLIDLVVKDTIDEDVLETLKRKENFSDNVLDRLGTRLEEKKCKS